MSTFLYVSGEDYSALEFEKRFNVEEFYKEMVKEDVDIKIIEDDNYYIKVKIVEFGEVDNDFIVFVLNNLCDYDVLKSENIYKVKG